MQTALTSLWCCAGWKFPSKLRIFSLPHHPPVGLHPSQGDKQNLFPAGTTSYLWIHQVQSRSDWAVVRRSRWRIHRATIERFISVYIGGQRYHLSAKLLCTTIQFCRIPLLIYRQLVLQTPKIVENFLWHQTWVKWKSRDEKLKKMRKKERRVCCLKRKTYLCSRFRVRRG